MSHRVLVAVTGPAEAGLVATLESERRLEVVHRCVDLAELLALAGSGAATAAFVGVELPRLDLDAVTRLRRSGVAVIGVHSRDPADGPRGASGLGFGAVVNASASAAELLTALESALTQTRGSAAHAGDPSMLDAASLGAPEPPESPGPLPGPNDLATDHGRVLAVWGPAGSPGRSTVAVNLAAELADRGASVVLADADTYAASVAQLLGVLDEAPGLAAACRAASAGTLDLVALARIAPVITERLRVLTGITRADRWPEISGPALSQVLQVGRRLADWTVIDTGFCLEQDEELSYDSFAPRRNAATLVCLEQADTVVAVGGADPVGLQRLVRGLSDLGELGLRPDAVVANRSRDSAVGGSAARRLREALLRFAAVSEVVLVPEDRAGLDAAVLAGRALREQVPNSAARKAIAGLAARLEVGLPERALAQ